MVASDGAKSPEPFLYGPRVLRATGVLSTVWVVLTATLMVLLGTDAPFPLDATRALAVAWAATVAVGMRMGLGLGALRRGLVDVRPDGPRVYRGLLEIAAAATLGAGAGTVGLALLREGPVSPGLGLSTLAGLSLLGGGIGAALFVRRGRGPVRSRTPSQFHDVISAIDSQQ